MYKEYLAEFWYSGKALKNSKVFFSIPTGGIYGEVGVNTFRNAIGAHYLPHSSEYVAPPSIDIVRKWFDSIGKEGYKDGDVTLYPTQVFSVNNWALKPNQPEEPPFTDHMLAICSAAKPVVFKAPKLSSNAKRVSQGTKPRAQPRHKKHSNSSKQHSMSSKEATKGGSFKAPTGSKTGHLKKKKDSGPTMESNPSQTSVSTPVVTEMHKDNQQEIGGPNSLGDASANSTTEGDPGKSTPSDFIPQQHGMNKGTKNTLYDRLFAGTDLHVLANQTQSVSEGLETVLNQSTSDKGASNIAKQIEEVEASNLDSPEDDPIIVVDDSDEDKEADKDGLHATLNTETEDASSQKHKLELEKNKAEAKAALLKAEPSFPNVGQLNELLVKSLQTKFSKILSTHNFSSSLPTELKDLPSKFNKLTEEVKGLKKQVHELKIKLLGDLKEIPTKLEDFTKTFTDALNQFAQAIASKKTKDTSIPLAGQVGTQPAEGEKNTNQTTISQLFQIKAAKNANLTKQQSKPTPPPTTTIIPSETTQMQSPSLQHLPKSSFQPEGEHIKKDKGKKAMYSKEAEKESTSSDSDDETHLTDSMVEPSKAKKIKKFDFVTERGKHIHLTGEEINHKKKIEEEAKAKAAKHESEL
ncbi:hypothetical protein Tco_1437180 [Tanacetum coccineum]